MTTQNIPWFPVTVPAETRNHQNPGGRRQTTPEPNAKATKSDRPPRFYNRSLLVGFVMPLVAFGMGLVAFSRHFHLKNLSSGGHVVAFGRLINPSQFLRTSTVL